MAVFEDVQQIAALGRLVRLLSSIFGPSRPAKRNSPLRTAFQRPRPRHNQNPIRSYFCHELLGARSDPDVTACSRDRTRTVQIKVKVRGTRSEQVPSWQWNLRQARQALDAPHTKYLLVLVDLAPSLPEYHICQLRLIARRVVEHHEDFLSRHRGTRPRTPESEHTVIHREAVASGKNAWERLGVLGK